MSIVVGSLCNAEGHSSKKQATDHLGSVVRKICSWEVSSLILIYYLYMTLEVLRMHMPSSELYQTGDIIIFPQRISLSEQNCDEQFAILRLKC